MIQSLLKAFQSPALWLAIGIAVLCVTLQVAGLEEVLRFDRDAIDQGAWWLLLTGNFVHLGISHLVMNLAGLLLVVVLVWHHYSMLEWLVVVLVSSLTVGIGLWQFDPSVFWYVGFSGTLHGLILAGVLADLKPYPRSAGLLLVLVIGKLGWEQIAGALPGSESVAGGSVVVNSHLYGAIAGLLCGVVLLARRYLRLSTVTT